MGMRLWAVLFVFTVSLLPQAWPQDKPVYKSTQQELSDAMSRAKYLAPEPRQLSDRDIRKLVQQAGVNELQHGPGSFIDAGYLSDGKVLLALRTDEHCLEVSVFRSVGVLRKHFEKIWNTTEGPRGEKFCSPTTCRSPRAIAFSHSTPSSNEKTLFRVIVPKQVSNSDIACDENEIFKFRKQEHGNVYVSEPAKIISAYDSFPDCFKSLDLVPHELAGKAQFIASIGYVPAFAAQKDFVILFAVDDKLAAMHTKVPFRLTTTPATSQLPSECVAANKGRYRPLSVPSDVLQKKIDELKNISVDSNRCIRRKNGDCALLFDGLYYRVAIGSSPPVLLTDVEGLKGLTNENPALESWVKDLLRLLRIPN